MEERLAKVVSDVSFLPSIVLFTDDDDFQQESQIGQQVLCGYA